MVRSITLALAAIAVLASVTPAAACPADEYLNVSGHCVPRPEFRRQAPRGATAKCRDGSYSFSEHHRGTCSHHGGVDTWL
jgi:hypothetical protein